MVHIQKALTNDGFVITDRLFRPVMLEKLFKELIAVGAFNYEQPQISNLLKACDTVKTIACDKALLKLLKQTTGENMFPVKAFILDKSTVSNWEIPWHQDLKIAVSQKIEEPGFNKWSSESGIPHVQPPIAVMEKLVTLRIHFDACDVTNAIYVVSGSHKLGMLTPEQIENLVIPATSHICIAEKNSTMLMKPLMLHYSPLSMSAKPRRILQIEFGYNLGNRLTWHDAVF